VGVPWFHALKKKNLPPTGSSPNDPRGRKKEEPPEKLVANWGKKRDKIRKGCGRGKKKRVGWTEKKKKKGGGPNDFLTRAKGRQGAREPRTSEGTADHSTKGGEEEKKELGKIKPKNRNLDGFRNSRYVGKQKLFSVPSQSPKGKGT